MKGATIKNLTYTSTAPYITVAWCLTQQCESCVGSTRY